MVVSAEAKFVILKRITIPKVNFLNKLSLSLLVMNFLLLMIKILRIAN
jgi:hypothetical protein